MGDGSSGTIIAFHAPRKGRVKMNINRGRLAVITGSLCLVAAAASQGGTPSSGTLSPANSTLTYTAGPFANDTQSAPVAGVTPTCVGNVLPCDQYALKVSIPPT